MQNQNKKPGLFARGWRGIVRGWQSNTRSILFSAFFTALVGLTVVVGGGIMAIVGLTLTSTILVSKIVKAIIDVIANKGKGNSIENSQTQEQGQTQEATQEQGKGKEKNHILATVDKVNNIGRSILIFASAVIFTVSAVLGVIGSITLSPVVIGLFIIHALFKVLSSRKAYKTIKESDERADLIKKPHRQQERSWWRALFGGGIKKPQEVEQAKQESQEQTPAQILNEAEKAQLLAVRLSLKESGAKFGDLNHTNSFTQSRGGKGTQERGGARGNSGHLMG